ncbi:MAG: pilus assembly protein PilC [Opitutus sp.]|nr:pilus assembly protein PilC [Opitutus sp.]
MPSFIYTACDSRGAEQSGQLEAADEAEVSGVLRQRGQFPVEIRPAEGPEDILPGAEELHWTLIELRLPSVSPVSAKQRAVFTRQLATLLGAGMPLLRGLEVLARQENSRTLRRIIASLGDGIRSGGTLSEALARHPRVFDRLYVNMAKAGEAGGVLDVVLERLAGFQEKSLLLRGKVRAALTYPAVVLAVSLLVLAGLLVFVVPKFQQIFADLLKGAPLPPLTQAVLGASLLVREHYAAVLAVLSAIWLAFEILRRTTRGARLIDGAVLRTPLLGGLILKSLVARAARTWGTLLAGGVPILQAIRITRETIGNARVAAAFDEVHDRVKEGAPVAAPLGATGVFPPMVAGLIEVGEHTGQLAAMLTKIAEIYDQEVDTAVAGLGSLLEPVLIVLLAGVVGTIVVALFLPIVRIVQLLT